MFVYDPIALLTHTQPLIYANKQLTNCIRVRCLFADNKYININTHNDAMHKYVRTTSESMCKRESENAMQSIQVTKEATKFSGKRVLKIKNTCNLACVKPFASEALESR